MLTALVTLCFFIVSSFSAAMCGFAYANFHEKVSHLHSHQQTLHKIFSVIGALGAFVFCLYCLYLMGFVSIILAILSLFLMTIPFFYGITRVVTICIPS